jgi:hypothetical protein
MTLVPRFSAQRASCVPPARPATSAAPLYRYNPSRAYVDAILRFAARIRRDRRAYLVFYARELIVRTPSGYRQLTRFGRPLR